MNHRYEMYAIRAALSCIGVFFSVAAVSGEPVRPGGATSADDAFAPAQINVPDGFSVELAAGPPLVTHPTLACLDDRGRLFVCNNAGLNLSAEELEEKLPNAIRLLEDLDGDGRFDRSTVFADKMTYPMGGAWHDGALYVASPPYIWRLEDTDGDGVADRRDILVRQFGYSGNAASIHGCFLGPDGRLYWCDGYHGHEFRDEAGQIRSKREGSYIFSCRPDGSDVRLHCGGGMDNPVEVDFTDEGEMLGTVNILYTRPRVDCLVHWLYGGAYPHRERVLSEIKVTGDLLGPAHRFGHVAVAGMARYRSGALDGAWRDNFFVTFFNSGKVVRLELDRDGATFHATQREFLSGTSRDFHPTDVLEDADGSLLVVDTGGWFYRGCPTSQLSKPDVLGAIYRVRRRGITTHADPWGKQMLWSKLSDEQLVATLNDDRHKVRQRAIIECAARGAKVVPVLQSTLQRGDIRQRRGAIWALTQMFGTDDTADPAARAALRLGLDDQSSSVRLTTCRSLATYADPAALERLAELVHRDEPAVRREAATALGRIGDPRAVPVLLAAIARDGDRTEEHALIFALIEINDPVPTAAGLAAVDANTRRGALIALDQMDRGNLTADVVAPLLDEDDAALRRAAVNVFRRHADDDHWATAAAKQLGQWLTDRSIQFRVQSAGKLVSTFAAAEPVAKLIGRRLTDSKLPPATRQQLLAALAGGHELPLHKSWVSALERALESDDVQTIESALAAVASIKTDRFDSQLQKLGADERRPALVRIAVLEALSGRGSRLSDSAFELLLSMTGGESAPREAARAAQLIGTASLTKDQLLALAPRLKTAGPLELRDLIRPFQRNAGTDVAVAFLAALEVSGSLGSLPTNELSDVVKRYPAELLPRANALLDRLKQQDEQRLARLDQLLPRLKTGDATRGREVFFAETSKCAVCHRIGEQGGGIGPDLSSIGYNRAPRDLLESIVFPSASFVRDYEPQTVVTTGGRILTGLIARETADAIYVQQQAGEPIRVPRSEIDEITPSTVSIMPNGLDKTLTESQLADVIAFLKSRNRPTAETTDPKTANQHGRQ